MSRRHPPRRNLADIPAITRIYAHAVEHGTASFELTPPDEAEMARGCRPCSTANFLISSPRSTAPSPVMPMPSLYRTRPAYRFTVEDSVYVAPHIHRRGIGRRCS